MSFKINGAAGEAIAIPDREYYFNTKARGRRMMGNSLSSDARRVYACLELATMGWQQELAVIMDAGEKRPLTPNDIRQQTGLLKQCVSRGLVELEDAGLALRKAPDGGALRKGNVLLYSWAVPREPKKENSKRARLLFPDWFPESWEPLKPFISRYKYSIIDDEVSAHAYFEEVAEAARVYQEAEMVVARALERVCAPRKRAPVSLYVERTEITKERTSSSSTLCTDSRSSRENRDARAREEEEDPPLYQQFKAAYPPGHFDEAKAKASWEKKTKAEKARIRDRLQVYLSCDRWQDDGGRWIPMASTWLQSYDADPPPKLVKYNGRQTRSLADLVKHKEMQDEFDLHANEINNALFHGRQLTARQQELLDHMMGVKT